MLSRRALAIAALAFSTVAAFAQSTQAQEKVVNVYNWNDYIDPKVLEDFTKETGIKVVYDTYDNNEIVETKMLAGKSGYDIVVPSAPFCSAWSRRASSSRSIAPNCRTQESLARDHGPAEALRSRQ